MFSRPCLFLWLIVTLSSRACTFQVILQVRMYDQAHTNAIIDRDLYIHDAHNS